MQHIPISKSKITLLTVDICVAVWIDSPICIHAVMPMFNMPPTPTLEFVFSHLLNLADANKNTSANFIDTDRPFVYHLVCKDIYETTYCSPIIDWAEKSWSLDLKTTVF